VISIAGARFLGPGGLGRQSFIAFAAATTINVVGGGLQLALMRAVGESVGAGRPREARGLVRWASRLLNAGAVAAAAVILTAALAGAEPRAAWILAAGIAALGVLTQVPGAVLAGLQCWRDLSLVILACSALGAVGTIGMLAAGGGVTGMFAVQLVVSTGIFAGIGALARRRLRGIAASPVSPARELRRKTLRYGGSAFAGTLVTLIVFRRSELFFLEHWDNSREIAIYSVAFSAVTTLVLVPQALAAAFLVGIVPGAAVFSACAALHILPGDDAAWVAESFGHLLRGRVRSATERISARDAGAGA
jgi:O-antigen/teichoic acid export membrane protein